MLTLVAFAVVCAEYAAACRAFVFLGLPAQEFIHAVISNELKIFYHAHVIFCAIALVQLFQSGAVFFAFKTKLYFTFLNSFAVFDFTSNTANDFIGICCSATGTFIFFSQISHADAAVHAAGCDQLCFKFAIHNSSPRVMSII